MIRIKQNRKLDYDTYLDFREFVVAGVDFGADILRLHPGINVENHRAYIDEFYLKHADEIERSVEEINRLLDNVQKKYFEAVKKYFEADYSEQSYVGFTSIFNCNPRFLEDKTFQLYYKKDPLDMLEVCFHEVMHFIFFDYCDKYLKKQTEHLYKNSGILWEISEIFNVILLNKPEFRKLLVREEKLFYSELKAKLDFAKEIFESNRTGTIKDVILEYLSVKRD